MGPQTEFSSIPLIFFFFFATDLWTVTFLANHVSYTTRAF